MPGSSVVSSVESSSAELQVFPRPRRFEFRRLGALVHSEPSLIVDSTIAEQGYELRITDGEITIRHRDEAGLRYAGQTLAQLILQFPGGLPGLIINDWPDTPNRCFLLDISRNRVPTTDTLAWLVEVLAVCRFNQLQLYIEHTFEFADHEIVWRDASPMTAAEMADLDGLCAANGIELIPCLNVFGHMERWLSHGRYRHRAECPDSNRPTTLEPTQANADFGLELIRELAATVTSLKINIGCDETRELGQGRSEAIVTERGQGDVFVDHLLRLAEPLIAEGHEVMFWADMFRTDPALLSRLPDAGATAVAWQYEPPAVDGGFADQVSQLATRGYPFWVAPGTATWHSLIGRWPQARANILDAVDVGIAAGAGGLLLTEWGDTGHMQPLSLSVVPMAFAAGVSWCAETNRDVDIGVEVDRVIFADQPGGLGSVIVSLGGLSDRCGRHAENGSALFFDLLVDPPFPVSGKATDDSLAVVVDALAAAHNALADSTPICAQSAEIKLELGAAMKAAMQGVNRMARLSGLDTAGDAELHSELTEAIECQRIAWLERNRPGGLEQTLSLLTPTLDTYKG